MFAFQQSLPRGSRGYGGQGNLELAAKSYQEAVSLDPSLSPAWYNLGMCLALLGCIDKSKDALKRAEKLGHPHARQTIEDFEKGGLWFINF